MRFYEYEARKIVELAGIPVTKYGFCTTAEEARAAAEEIGGPTVIKSQVLSGGPDEGGRRQVRRHPRGGRRARRGDPRAGDQRPHAARRPRRPESRGQAGVLRERRLGRDREAAADAVQRHGRHRHRGGRRDPPRPRRPRPRHQPDADPRLRGQAGDRRDRRHRLPAQPRDADPRQARPPLPRLRHDPGRDQPAGRARRRQLRRPRRPHGDGGGGGRAAEGPAPQAARDRRGRHPRHLRALRLRAQRRPRSTPPTTAG